MSLQTIQQNDSASTARGKMNEAINAVSRLQTSGTPGGTIAGEKKLNILVVGNSHSCDFFSYVPFILKEYGVNVQLGIFYSPGKSIGYHNENYEADPTNTQYQEAQLFVIDTETDNSWSVGNDPEGVPIKTTSDLSYKASVQKAVRYAPWDIVVFHQSHTTSYITKNFGSSIESLRTKISNDLGKPFMLGWMIGVIQPTSSYPVWTRYSMLAHVKNACLRHGFDMIFPGGTAIFNAMNDLTLCPNGDDLHDGSDLHLKEGLPCYIGALANVEAIFRKFYPTLNIWNDATRTTTSWVSGKNIPNPQGTPDNSLITDANCRLAQQMAILANDYPFDIANDTFSVKMHLGSSPYKVVAKGTLWNDGAGVDNQSFVGNTEYNYKKHSDVLLEFEPYGDYDTLDAVTYTIKGVTYDVAVENNVAVIHLFDVVDDIVINTTASISGE